MLGIKFVYLMYLILESLSSSVSHAHILLIDFTLVVYIDSHCHIFSIYGLWRGLNFRFRYILRELKSFFARCELTNRHGLLFARKRICLGLLTDLLCVLTRCLLLLLCFLPFFATDVGSEASHALILRLGLHLLELLYFVRLVLRAIRAAAADAAL